MSDGRILFGQSAAFSGPAQELGHGMRLGIQAAFHEQNEKGGVHGRMLELTTLDDQDLSRDLIVGSKQRCYLVAVLDACTRLAWAEVSRDMRCPGTSRA